MAGNLLPDHTTIARFRATHADALAGLFTQVLAMCAEAGLVKVGTIAVDGTKIAVSASLDANRTREAITKHRDKYYERLQAVRESADIEGWLIFFLEAVRAQADDAVTRSRRLSAVRERYHSEAIKGRSSLPRLVDIIMRNPFATVKSVQVEVELELTNQGARNLIKNAETRGWLRSLDTRARRSRTLVLTSHLRGHRPADESHRRVILGPVLGRELG
ncbi:hypothetical protein [Microbacterium sp.]|uniref:hypothetical protein n=1 Tax=Microbacterium sp. TaxID=51671 RepID=UPI0025E885B1|nr:hypothetical protein [Microbacterium sp.]